VSVTIADILGANDDENKDDDDITRYIVYPQGETPETLDRYKFAADEALELYRQKSGGVDIGVAIIPLISTPDDSDEKWIFLVEIENFTPVGMIVFPADKFESMFGILMGLFSEHFSESEGDDS